SIKVCVWPVAGMITPLQRGQWLPHPAPEPVARTYAPHRITKTLYAATNQAKCATGGSPVLEMLVGRDLNLSIELPGHASAVLTVVPMILYDFRCQVIFRIHFLSNASKANNTGR